MFQARAKRFQCGALFKCATACARIAAQALTPRVMFVGLVCGLVVLVSQHASASGAHENGDGQWTLSRLIDEAVANHPSIRASKDAAQGGKARVRSARWQYFPTPSVGVETQTLGGNPVLTADLTQPIWTGGRLSADFKLAKAQWGASKWGVAEAQNELALQIVEQYRGFSSAVMTLSAYDRYIADLTEFSMMMQRRVAQGYSANVDAKLVSARLNEARNVRTNLLLTRNTARESLSYLVGHDLALPDIALPNSDFERYELSISDPEFLQRSMDINPTLNRLSEEITAAQAGVAQARSALSPVVSLRAQHRELSFSPVTENRVFLSLDFSLGGGLSALENIRAARSEKSQAYHSREAFRIDLGNIVRNDLEALKATRQLIVTLLANRVTQEEIYQSYLRMFLVGQRTWLDVLNVMREAVEAERRLAEAQTTYEATLFRLRINVGDISWSR